MNETLIRALQGKLISTGAISTRESIVRIPRMAHVIYLGLKQLLWHIRTAPMNKEVKTFLFDAQAISLRLLKAVWKLSLSVAVRSTGA